jgi:hypothetical protein
MKRYCGWLKRLIFFQEDMVRRLLKISLIMLTLGLAGFASLTLAAVEPRVMGDDIFDTLTKGFNDLSQSKFPAAQAEFEKIIKTDFDNPYANNNMAVIMEKQGKLLDAMAYLTIGEKLAEDYRYKAETAYLLGGVCAAVNPEKILVEKSIIAQVIAANKKKLSERLAAKPAEIPQHPGK